jgi:hypothetical protein
MARPNFLTLPRPPRPEVRLEVSDPEQPAVEPFEMVLRKPGPYEATLAASKAQEFFDKWQETSYPMPGGPLEITLELAQMLATIQVMQPAGEDALDIEQLVGILINMPTAWEKLIVAASGLMANELLLGNPSGAA